MYYRNHIYTDEQKEKLWLEKLNKEIRWINGRKIDVSKGDKEYLQLLKYAQEKNIELGYGTGNADWKQEQYEKELREIKRKERDKWYERKQLEEKIESSLRGLLPEGGNSKDIDSSEKKDKDGQKEYRSNTVEYKGTGNKWTKEYKYSAKNEKNKNKLG